MIRSTLLRLKAYVAWTLSLAGLYVLTISMIACNESLPSYEEPHSLFLGTVTAEYRWLRTGSELWFHLDARNVFDETLQGNVLLTGTLEIVLLRAPQHHKTVTLSRDMLVPSQGVTQIYNQLTVGRDDTVKLVYKWNYVDDDGVFLPTDVFDKHNEEGFPGIFLSDPETFLIKGSLQVFDKTGQLTFPPTNYILVYYY